MESTCYNVFAKKKRNPKMMALPTTSTHLLQHLLWAHLQIWLWKSDNREGTAEVSSTMRELAERSLIGTYLYS